MFKNLIGSLTLLTAATIIGVNAVDYTFNIGNANLAPDGFSRSTVVVNGQFPGPLITATKGELINVKVRNQLTDPTMRRSTSIHWHGFFASRNAHNDGPAFVTQCPIAPNNEYNYVIDARTQAGTYWYHSHLSSQYLDGLRGPIVVKDPNDPNKSIYDVDDASTVIVLADWFHDPAPGLEATYLSANNSIGVDVLPKSGTINGVGRTSTSPQPPRPVFTVQRGKRYRFRIINASAITKFHFQFQNHPMAIIEADGEPHTPLNVDHLTIYPGMRYSVVVNANRPIDNYWIHAPMAFDRVINPDPNWATDSVNVNAVLHYQGAPNAEPITPPPTNLTGRALDASLLIPVSGAAVPGQPFIGGADRVFNLTFGAGVDAVRGWGFNINGVRYDPPTVPTLLKILSGARNDADFTQDENTRIIRRGEVVEININGFPDHPFHLHGHIFHVVRGATGPANFINPPKRDVTPTGGTGITIRFVADNPGPWILHCHIDLHLEGGLAMVFAEDPEGTVTGNKNVVPSAEWQQLCNKYNALPPDQQ